jgi:site-specific DNA recombinase
VRVDQVDIHLRSNRLGAVLDEQSTGVMGNKVAEGEPVLVLSVPADLRRAGKDVRIIIDRADPFAPPRTPDPTLITAIVRAQRFNEKLVHGTVTKFGDLEKGEGLHRFYLTQLLRLAYLAPDITEAILDGRQPARLTATMLIEHADLPLTWREQRRILGFAGA